MTTGFELIGNSGAIQADDKFASLVFKQKGTGIFDNNGQQPGPLPLNFGVTAGLTITGQTPVIAVRANFGISICNVSISGNNYTYSFVAAKNAQEDNSGKSFDWFLFDKPSFVNSSPGFIITDANGNITFDGLQKYMRLVGTQLTQGQQGSYASSNLAVVMTNIAGALTATQVTVSSYRVLLNFFGFQVIGNTVVPKSITGFDWSNQLPPQGPWLNTPSVLGLIIDVDSY